MAKPVRKALPRPHLKSAFQLHFHIEENSAASITAELGEFLVSADKRRRSVTETAAAASPSTEQRKKYTVTVGMRETLKSLRSSNQLPRAVVLDASVFAPSAVSNVFGLLATSQQRTRFYALSDINSVVAPTLRLPRVSIIGFGADCFPTLESVFDRLVPVSVGLKIPKSGASEGSLTTTNTFSMPQLQPTPGKPGKLSKKQLKAAAARLKK